MGASALCVIGELLAAACQGELRAAIASLAAPPMVPSRHRRACKLWSFRHQALVLPYYRAAMIVANGYAAGDMRGRRPIKIDAFVALDLDYCSARSRGRCLRCSQFCALASIVSARSAQPQPTLSPRQMLPRGLSDGERQTAPDLAYVLLRQSAPPEVYASLLNKLVFDGSVGTMYLGREPGARQMSCFNTRSRCFGEALKRRAEPGRS